MTSKKTFFCIVLSSFAALSLLFLSCSNPHAGLADDEEELLSGLNPEKFTTEIDSLPVALYTLKNSAGMEVCITNYGARIVSLVVPDKAGNPRDVILGFDSIAPYIADNLNIGAAVGPYAGFLTDNTLTLVGSQTTLPADHSTAFSHQVFRADLSSDSTLTLRLIYPAPSPALGTLIAQYNYTISPDNALRIDITAITDAPTPVDLSQQLYFNLNGVTDSLLSEIASHSMTLASEQYVVRDSLQRITGNILMTSWTTLDFSKPKKLKSALDADFRPIRFTLGLDTYFVSPTYGLSPSSLLTLSSPESGITLTLTTDMPGLHLYATNRFDGSITGKNALPYSRRKALAILPHEYPDAPNNPGWGHNPILQPSQVFNKSITYSFTTSD